MTANTNKYTHTHTQSNDIETSRPLTHSTLWAARGWMRTFLAFSLSSASLSGLSMRSISPLHFSLTFSP